MNPRTTYVDPLLTSVYVAYNNTELIAEKLFPKVAVNKESGIYFKSDKSNLRSPADTKRGLNGGANRVSNVLTEDTFSLVEHTLEHWIDDRILKTYDMPFEPRKNGTNLIAGQLAVEKEKALRDSILNNTTGLDVAGAWNTGTTDIRGAVRLGANTIHKSTGTRPNVMVLDRVSLDGILKNNDFVAAIAYTKDKTEDALMNLLAGYFDVQKVLIAGGINNTAKEGQTDSMDWIWSTKGLAILAYVAPTPAIDVPSAGYEFYKPDMTKVDVRREEGKKSDVVRATDFYVQKIVDANCLYVMEDTITT